MKIKIALTVGPDEAANDSVAVKNLVNGEQITVKREAVFDIVKKLMD
jgi:histidyl-tRNA synthetase